MKRNAIAKMKLADIPQMTEWMAKLAGRNNIDPEVLGYPATEVLKATNGSKVIMYLPVQTTFFLESLAINPEASALETAGALRDLFTVIGFEARSKGLGEAYFLCADEQTRAFAEHNGLEPVNLPLYRMRLGS